MNGRDGYDRELGVLVTGYIERVVNRRDLRAIDDMVSPDYTGTGPEWATDIGQLRRFYEDQIRDRPDWHIDVRSTLELGDSVVVRAEAGGTVTVAGKQSQRRLEWLTHYRVRGGVITEINILSVIPLPTSEPG